VSETTSPSAPTIIKMMTTASRLSPLTEPLTAKYTMAPTARHVAQHQRRSDGLQRGGGVRHGAETAGGHEADLSQVHFNSGIAVVAGGIERLSQTIRVAGVELPRDDQARSPRADRSVIIVYGDNRAIVLAAHGRREGGSDTRGATRR